MSEDIKFEKALEKLEKIVEDLEAGKLSLEDALACYEEGVKLSVACQRKLATAEKKIELLTKSLDGSLKKEPFDLETAPEKSAAVPRKAKTSKPATEDEDMLI